MDETSLAFVIINCIILVCTCIECLVVLALFSQETKHRKASHLFVISMCVADLVHVVLGCGVLIHMGFGLKLMDETCHLEIAILLTSHVVSLVNTIICSIDRFFAVVYPLQYQSKMDVNKSCLLIFIGWTVAIAFGISSLAFKRDLSTLRPDVVQRKYNTSCLLVANVLHPNYLMFLAFGVVLPFIVAILVIYIMIYSAMRNVFKATIGKSEERSLVGWLRMHRDLERFSEINIVDVLKVREVRATLILFATITIFLLCWFPAVIIMIVHKIRPILGTTTEPFLVFTLLKIYSMINPILYAFTIKDMRKAFKLLMSKITCFMGTGNGLSGRNTGLCASTQL